MLRGHQTIDSRKDYFRLVPSPPEKSRYGVRTCFEVVFRIIGYANSGPASDYMTALLCALNAAFHASAWSYRFPTPLEGILWRVSCIMFGSAPLAQASGFYV